MVGKQEYEAVASVPILCLAGCQDAGGSARESSNPWRLRSGFLTRLFDCEGARSHEIDGLASQAARQGEDREGDESSWGQRVRQSTSHDCLRTAASRRLRRKPSGSASLPCCRIPTLSAGRARWHPGRWHELLLHGDSRPPVSAGRHLRETRAGRTRKSIWAGVSVSPPLSLSLAARV